MSHRSSPLSLALLLVGVLSSCSPEDPDRHDPPPGDTGPEETGLEDTGPQDTSTPTDTGDPLPEVEGCRSEFAAANRDRVVVVGLPYDATGRSANTWAVLTLDTEGQLTDTGERFEMGRGYDGEVVFTRDGEIGLVAQEDGTLGVFQVSGEGEVSVVHEAFDGGFYASAVVVEPGGEAAWVVDYNWAENGGGLYRVEIDCEDGTLSNTERRLQAKLPADLLLLRYDLEHAVLAGREADGQANGEDAWLLEWGDEPGVLGGADAFGDDEASVSDAVLTFDDRYALLADNSLYSGVDNRVAVVGVGEDGVSEVQVISPLEDPVALVASPWDDLVLAVSGYANAFYLLAYDPDSRTPFTELGEPSYTGASPALPMAATLLWRGDLAGTVLVTENQGVRLGRFEGDGVYTDQGEVSLGSGYDAIAGAVGIQP